MADETARRKAATSVFTPNRTSRGVTSGNYVGSQTTIRWNGCCLPSLGEVSIGRRRQERKGGFPPPFRMILQLASTFTPDEQSAWRCIDIL